MIKKFIHISDTHCQDLGKILKGKSADVLCITGDMTFVGSFKEMYQFRQDLKDIRQDFDRIVWHNGNHERDLWMNPGICEDIAADTNTDYLLDSGVEIDGIKIWGSPYTPKFFDWGFMYDRSTTRWDVIPEGTHIVMIHGPCRNILDLCPDGFHAGCDDLGERIKKIKPLYHLFGHVHCAKGKVVKGGTTFLNSSICDEAYNPTYKPQEFFIDL